MTGLHLREDGKWVVSTEKGDITANRIVNAAGNIQASFCFFLDSSRDFVGELRVLIFFNSGKENITLIYLLFVL